MTRTKPGFIGLFAVMSLLPVSLHSQEKTPTPYFVPYDHYMEEVDTLEVEVEPVLGQAPDLPRFLAGTAQFEYGLRSWWTAEVYLDWQHTQHENTVFTGFRFENRFRLWQEQHKINPVLYVEYAHLTAADKILREIVGFDSKRDLAVPNSISDKDHEDEIETRLILSSDIGQWNLAGNFIGEKNLSVGPFEFGYAFGVRRPLAPAAGNRCAFCAEKFSAGVEFYGGLGTGKDFTVRRTSQYIAPVFLWTLASETNIHVSVGWGLTDSSLQTLFRIGLSQEVDGIGRKIGSLFRKR